MNSVRLFASAVILALAAAVAPAEAQAPAKPFRVVTTFTVIQDIAQNVAGDKAIVESITKPGAEIHDYQPTPLDIVKAQAADLVLWNGFNLERWFERSSTTCTGCRARWSPKASIRSASARALTTGSPIRMPGCRHRMR